MNNTGETDSSIGSLEYQVNLDVFQGPLDLLLFLIRKKKIDIHDIPIATITREYLVYLDQKERINLEREAEFLLVAALLIYIKSQMLLPRERVLDDEEDPRQVLVDRLLEYQKIKAACAILRQKEADELPKWKRDVPPPHFMGEELDLAVQPCRGFFHPYEEERTGKRPDHHGQRVLHGRENERDH
jgi:segregation and condensation protein A